MHWLAALLAVLMAWPASAMDRATRLPGKIAQGALIIASTAPGNQIWLGQQRLRVDAAGRFVFGVGRDETGPLTLRIVWFDGIEEQLALPVATHDWPTERIEGVPENTVNPPPAIAERIAREQAQVGTARERDDDRSDFAQGFIWPVRGRISGLFGSQRIYNGTPKSPHPGLDVAAPTGTPVKAPAAGVITFAAPDLYLTGGTVLIDHGHGVSSNFLHLSRLDVRVGQRVEQGQVIGRVGATGRATGPHMHWGMNWFGVRVDPQSLLDAASVKPLAATPAASARP